MSNLKELDMGLHSKVKLLSRFVNLNSKFTVFLSDLVYSELQFTNYPVNQIITYINDTEILDYNSLIEIMKNPLKSFKTINNEIYFV